MMIEATLGLFGGALGVLLVYAYTIKATLDAHSAAIAGAIGAIEDLQDVAQNLADNPQPVEEMLNVLSEMHVPTGQDHIQAALATGMNMLFAKMLGGSDLNGMMGLLGGSSPENGHVEQPPEI
jgi:hypothetical protein